MDLATPEPRPAARRPSLGARWALLLVGAVLAFAVVGSCWSSLHREVALTLVGCREVSQEPTAGLVHPGRYGDREPLREELLEITFTTDVSLESLTGLTQGHWCALQLLPGEDLEFLWTGSIWKTERAASGDGDHRYRVFVPVAAASRLGEWRPEDLPQLVRERGLGIRVRGGLMGWLASLQSNLLAVPLEMAADGALAIREGH